MWANQAASRQERTRKLRRYSVYVSAAADATRGGAAVHLARRLQYSGAHYMAKTRFGKGREVRVARLEAHK